MKHSFILILGWIAASPFHVSAQEASQETAQAAAPAAPNDAVEPRSDASPELDAIRAGSKVFVDAFNQQDAKAVAALWTEDAEYIDDSEAAFVGRDAIEQAYAALFAQNADARIEVVIDSLRMVSKGVVIEEGRALLDPPPSDAPGFSKYTAVHVKVDSGWKLASVRDSWVETSATPNSVGDVSWLIGTWVSEEHGVRAESVYRWVADERFIQRVHTTTNLDGSKSSGVQLIGWNASEAQMQSWSFSSDGGFAVGIWKPAHGGWSAQMIGVTGEGIHTSAVNRLVRLDENACVWQSTDRSVGGTPLPDTDEVVWKRQPDQQ